MNMTFADHVAAIASSQGIEVVSHTRGGRAYRRTKTVAIRPVKSSVTYAVALHELGHILGRQPRLRMDRELAAWEWAKENALRWDATMQAKMDKCLGHYLKRVESGKIKGATNDLP